MVKKKIKWTIMYGEHYGASNHSEGEREMNDYYATEPYAAQLLMEVEQFNSDIWECACRWEASIQWVWKEWLQCKEQRPDG